MNTGKSSSVTGKSLWPMSNGVQLSPTTGCENRQCQEQMRKNAREDQAQKCGGNKYQSIDNRSRRGLRPSRTPTEQVEPANYHKQKLLDP